MAESVLLVLVGDLSFIPGLIAVKRSHSVFSLNDVQPEDPDHSVLPSRTLTCAWEYYRVSDGCH